MAIGRMNVTLLGQTDGYQSANIYKHEFQLQVLCAPVDCLTWQLF